MLQKNTLWGLLLTVGMGLSMSSCHDDSTSHRFSDKKGGISPQVELSTSVISSKTSAGSRAINISVSDLALKLTGADGYSHTWPSADDFDETAEFSVGDYTMEAFYGTPDQEGFDRPAYAGTTTFTVRENQTTPVNLTASLVNSMISVDYTDEFKDYMSTWNAEFRSSTGKTVYYGAQETRPLYVKPGEVTVDVTFSKSGAEPTTLQIAKVTARPRYHYHITVGLANHTGGTSLAVSFDENLNQEEVTIDLSDELLNAPAPEIEGYNLAEGETFHYIEGNTPERAALNIIARGGVSEVNIITNSTTLNQQGWPVTLTLNSSTKESLRQNLSDLGLDVRGVYGETTGKLAALDFTDVPPSLEYLENHNDAEFTVTVVDKYSKVSEPFTFKMQLTPLFIRLSNPGQLPVAATELDLDLEYNGDDPENKVEFRILNDRGHWTKVKTKEIKPDGENKYRVKLDIPACTRTVTVSATAASKTSKNLVVPHTGLPAFTVAVPAECVWATKADVTISSTAADPELLAKGATYYVSQDGVNYTPATVSSVNGGTATLSGLSSGVQYKLKVAFGDNEALAAQPVDFTTEEALPVPNGDFENLATTKTANNQHYGGQYRNAATSYWNTLTYEISEPTGWKSVNDKTMCGSNQNSWFSQPAVFNTSLNWVASCPGLAVLGTGRGSETPSSFKDFKVHSGSNAMVIRNVAWDPAGTDPELVSTSSIANYYYWNPTVPTISRRAVGRMFLGSSYTYNKTNRTEVHNQGVTFASRPTALEGWYYYTPDQGEPTDQGAISIEIYNGADLIGEGYLRLAAVPGYVKFTCPIEYFDNIVPKATHLRIMIESSIHGTPGTPRNENSSVVVTTYNDKYEAFQHGATLVVDDFSFVY